MNKQTKKIILILSAIFACANMAVAQVTISRSELVGTTWQPAEVYERHGITDCEFTKEAFIVNGDRGGRIIHPYYLSNTIPAKFDSRKVGVSTKGCYYNEYLDENHFCCYAILSFDKSKGVMVLDLKSEPFLGPTTITYIRIDKLTGVGSQ